jgi:uncharacterized 2Fe-2S/4Fe-4S cluster protein (DUF4445 family)
VEVEKFGQVRSCRFRLAGTYRVKVPAGQQFEVVQSASEEGFFHGKTQNPSALLVAIDIGTTTVAWSGCYRNREVRGGFVNPQRQFGADVMSRIRACSEGQLAHMQKVLTDALRADISSGIDGLLPEDAQVDVTVAVAANTTMLHILNGWDCAGLGKAPFAPQSVALWQRQEGRLSVTELPGISTFVGADIVSGMYALGLAARTSPALFLDLGTNGEMAVGAGGHFLVTSTAAGPAFEASELALSIHASGLLRILHEMLDAGAMDENGTLCETYFASGYPVGAEGAVVTQGLVRDLQMAKAAIRAGIEILLREYRTTAEEIDTLYLAGGMGYFIEPEDALAVGLIPEGFRGKIVPVGNASLRGAARYLEEPETAQEAFAGIAGGTEEILLADREDFEELYIQYMSFPRKEGEQG